MINHVIGWVNGKPRLRKLTADECTTLIEQLTHRKSRVRWMAADLLGKQRAPESVDPLMLAIRDPQWLVRLHAATALGRIGDRRAFEALSAALADEHAAVRLRAIRAVGQLADQRAIPELLRVFQHDPALRKDVARSLSNLVTPQAADMLMRATTSGAFIQRSGLALQLGRALTPVLVVLLTCTRGVLQYWIIRLLGRIGDQRAIPALRTHSADVRSQFQHAAYRALSEVEYRYYAHLIPSSI